jgi:hypothetical protein
MATSFRETNVNLDRYESELIDAGFAETNNNLEKSDKDLPK